MVREKYLLNYSKNIVLLACQAIKLINEKYSLTKNPASWVDKILNSDLNDREIEGLINELDKDGNCPNIFILIEHILKSQNKILFTSDANERAFNTSDKDIFIILQNNENIKKLNYANKGISLIFSIKIDDTTMIDKNNNKFTNFYYKQGSHSGYVYCFQKNNQQAIQQPLIEEIKEIKEIAPTRSLRSSNRLNTPIISSYQGLPNIGNTCYLNSVLQILKWTEAFEFSIQNSENPPIPELKNVLRKMNSQQNIRPYLEALILSLNREFKTFQLRTNHDAKELFVAILGQIEDNSANMFGIEFHKKLECIHKNGQSHIEKIIEKSLFICLPSVDNHARAPSRQSRTNSRNNNSDGYFTRLRKEQLFEGKNALKCNRTNKLETVKISTERINFPLNLAVYVPPSHSMNENIKMEFTEEDTLYRLYGMIAYIPHCLHYFCYVLIENIWVKFDDHVVSYENPRFEFAYLLFYKASPLPA